MILLLLSLNKMLTQLVVNRFTTWYRFKPTDSWCTCKS